MKTHRIFSSLTALGAALALAVTLPLLAQDEGDDEAKQRGPRGWEGFAERHDVNGDGQVTQEELHQTLDLFETLDTDGSGTVTEADFDARHSAHAFAFAARRADDNRDRQVTTAEWDAWFAEADSNGDGALTADDRAENGDRRRGRGARGEKMAEALDADGDGSVTRADFAALASRFDANADGVLTEDELPRVRHRGHHRGGHKMGRHGHH